VWILIHLRRPSLRHTCLPGLRGPAWAAASALALITGVAPEIISSKNAGDHYSDTFMIGFLRARSFETLRLTPKMVSGAKTKIGPDHVLLLSVRCAGEGTWGVVYADHYYHNFECYVLSSLAFLNRPVMSAYLVIHPKWRINYVAEKPKPRATAQGPQLTLAAVRKDGEFTKSRTWAQ
jgi:hypothetical protein